MVLAEPPIALRRQGRKFESCWGRTRKAARDQVKPEAGRFSFPALQRPWTRNGRDRTRRHTIQGSAERVRVRIEQVRVDVATALPLLADDEQCIVAA